jgi:hypothetical protein
MWLHAAHVSFVFVWFFNLLFAFTPVVHLLACCFAGGPASIGISPKTLASIPAKFETILNIAPKEARAFGSQDTRFRRSEVRLAPFLSLPVLERGLVGEPLFPH